MKPHSNLQHKDRFIKLKASFEIFLVVTLSLFISLSLNTEQVLAGCCAQANSGEFCLEEATESQCAEGYTDTTCTNNPACTRVGCCEKQDGCTEQTSEASCLADENAEFHEGISCQEIQTCRPSCCIRGNSCSLKTPSLCEQSGGTLNLEITDPVNCIRTCSQQELGCCTDNCEYTRGALCSPENFFPEITCARAGTCAERCTAHAYTDCGDDGHVYWYDSCNNQEERAENCNPNGLNGPTTNCADSDNNGKGDTCDSLDCDDVWDNPVVDENGNCPVNALPDNSCYTDDPTTRKHLDSWCEYEAAVGPSLDLPGTRHYRHYCLNGKEYVQPCNSDRSEICVYGEASSLLTGERKAIGTCVPNLWKPCVQADNQETCEAGGGMCVWIAGETSVNIREQLDTGKFNVTFIALYQTHKRDDPSDAWDEEEGFLLPGEEELELKNEKVYSDNKWAMLEISGAESHSLSFGDALREDKEVPLRKYSLYRFSIDLPEGDYHFKITPGDVNLPSLSINAQNLEEITKNLGKCMPLVASEADDICEAASYQGDKALKGVTFWSENAFGFDDLECEQGCEIYRQPDFKLGANTICNSYGRCGAKYNLAGKFSNKGFSKDCLVGHDYSNIESECPVEKNRIQEGEKDLSFNKYKAAGAGLKVLNYNYQDALLGRDFFLTNTLGWLSFIGGTLLSGFPLSSYTTLLLSPLAVNGLAAFAALGIVAVLGTIAYGFFNLISGAFQDEEQRDVGSLCTAWEPPAGGEDCNKCHLTQREGGVLPNNPFTQYDEESRYIPAYECTEQLCTSLGSHCTFVEDTPDGPRCTAVEPNDVFAPQIVVESVEYTCDSASSCSENKNGELTINGELEEFSRMSILLKTLDPESQQEELAECRFSTNGNYLFDDYTLYFKEQNKKTPLHNLTLTNLESEKEYNIFVRCQDVAGNADGPLQPFILQFKTARQPDGTAVDITNYEPSLGRAYTAADQTTLHTTLLLNEEAPRNGGCKWSKEPNIAFTNMVGSFTCSPGTLTEQPTCEATLTGIESDTSFYFRCQDLAGNTHDFDWPSGEPYLVKKSAPLVLDSIQCIREEHTNCDEPIYEKEINFNLQTSGGADSGYSTCEWRVDNRAWNKMLETGENNHQQPGFLAYRGDATYNVDFRCEDFAGNKIEVTKNLVIDTDESSPVILSTYLTGNSLNIRTDEQSICSFVLEDEQRNMSTINGVIHQANEDITLYKLRCQDKFRNIGSYVNVHIVS